MKSAAAASFLAASSLCPGPPSVRLRPDATYVQLGDVDVPGARCVRIVHISDTPAGRRDDLSQLIPAGDVLVHSGGLECPGGLLAQPLEPLLEQRHMRQLRDFLAALPHRHKILVPGSQDTRLHKFASSRSDQELQRKLGPCHYLHDSSVTLEGVTFYGTSGCGSSCKAKGTASASAAAASATASRDSGEQTTDSWQKVPDNVDVLVTHNPPWEQLAHDVFQRVRPKALLHGQVKCSENGAQWRDGVLVSNGSLAKVSKPVVIDFYTSSPGNNSHEYSEVMEVTSRLKRAGPNSSCAVM